MRFHPTQAPIEDFDPGCLCVEPLLSGTCGEACGSIIEAPKCFEVDFLDGRVFMIEHHSVGNLCNSIHSCLWCRGFTDVGFRCGVFGNFHRIDLSLVPPTPLQTIRWTLGFAAIAGTNPVAALYRKDFNPDEDCPFRPTILPRIQSSCGNQPPLSVLIKPIYCA